MFPAFGGIQVQGRRSRLSGINHRNTLSILRINPPKFGGGLKFKPDPKGIGPAFHRADTETCPPHRQRHLRPADWAKSGVLQKSLLVLGFYALYILPGSGINPNRFPLINKRRNLNFITGFKGHRFCAARCSVSLCPGICFVNP